MSLRLPRPTRPAATFRRPLWGSAHRLACTGLLTVLALAGQLFPLLTPSRDDQAQAAAPPDPRFGVVEAYRAPDLASEAGVAWERIIFNWWSIQPGSAADWNGAYLPDGILQREMDQGRSVVGLLIGTPAWASDAGRRTDPPRNLYLPYDHPDNYWGQFVYRIAAQYRGRIDTWVVWNEPDVWDASHSGFTWGGSESDFYQLLKVAYQAAKAADPESQVLLPGLTYWWDASHGREQYLTRLLKLASQDPTAPEHHWYFDAVVLQLYNEPASLRRVPLEYRQRLAEFGLQKPVWINETNVAPWDDPLHPLSGDWFRATRDEQASYLIQAFAYALTADVERLSVYKMVDELDLPREAEPFGLVRPDGSRRPVYAALQTAISQFSGVTGGQVAEEGEVVRIVLHRPGERVSVVWSARPQPATVRVPAVAAGALLVRSDGQQEWRAASDGVYELTLAPATYHTVPGMPDYYPIGGTPLILVEPESASDAAAPPDSGQQPIAFGPAPGCESGPSMDFPITGHSVCGKWLEFFERAGLEVMGYPRSGVVIDPTTGQWVQYFQRVVLEWHPQNPPQYQVLRRLLADQMYPGADAPLEPAPASSRRYAFFATSAAAPTGLGHGVGDYAPDGTNIGFKAFFDAHGGVMTFGYPKEEAVLRDGRWRQRFQAAVFEYHPENRPPYNVQLELLGDRLLEQRGAE